MSKSKTKDDKKTTKSYMLSILGDNIKPPIDHKHLPREKGIVLSKARTNSWTDGFYYLTKIEAETNKMCRKCKGKEDTTEHILDECDIFLESRQILLAKLKHKYKNITEILCTKNNQEIEMITEFLLMVKNSKRQERKKESTNIRDPTE